MKAQNILQTIGNTPHVRIRRLFGNAEGQRLQVWIKAFNAPAIPGGSIKTASRSRWWRTPRRAARSTAAPSSSPPRATSASA